MSDSLDTSTREIGRPVGTNRKCPNCGKEMENGFMGINAFGALGGILYAESPEWFSKKSALGTGGESLQLEAGLSRIFWLEGARCTSCRTMLLSY